MNATRISAQTVTDRISLTSGQAGTCVVGKLTALWTLCQPARPHFGQTRQRARIAAALYRMPPSSQIERALPQLGH